MDICRAVAHEVVCTVSLPRCTAGLLLTRTAAPAENETLVSQMFQLRRSARNPKSN